MPDSKILDQIFSHLVDVITVEKNHIRNPIKELNISFHNGTSHFVHAILINNRILGTDSAYCGIDIYKIKESFRGINFTSYHQTFADGLDYYYSATSSDLAAITSGYYASSY